MPDTYAEFAPSLTSPAMEAANVSPSDATSLPNVSRALYVGSAGDLAVEMMSGDVVTFRGVAGGTALPVRARKVRASGTTAADIVALW